MYYILRLLVIVLCSTTLDSYAANVCDPVNVVNCASVNASASGNEIHTSAYGYMSPRVPSYAGQKATYVVSVDTGIGTTTSGVHAAICGSDRRTVRVIRVELSGTAATTAARLNMIWELVKTQPAGGTAYSNLPITVLDSLNDPTESAALVNIYTSGATSGILVGTVASRVNDLPITATIAATDKVETSTVNFDDTGYVMYPVLRGTSQCLQGRIVGAATVPTITGSIVWTEE